MQLGCFSISLNVKDIHTSKAFYEKFGFSQYAGDVEQKWLIMKNGQTNIGLFEGMLENNTLTFNPGWDQNARETETFTDIRIMQTQLKAQGVEFISEVDRSSLGPGSFVVLDPDNNPILVDQHR